MEKPDLSKRALKRMPYYFSYLKDLEADNVMYVSAPTIAKLMDMNAVQVRKDLAAVSKSQGLPKKGFEVKALLKDVGDYLGYNKREEAVLIGVGHLGKALLSFKGFDDYGLDIVAAFDSSKALVGKRIRNKTVFDLPELEGICRKRKIRIAIITVPAEYAQEIADVLINAGILAIWNFAPVHIKVPEHILVQNENMASSLAVLSNHLRARLGDY